jgi:hypothetical protein
LSIEIDLTKQSYIEKVRNYSSQDFKIKRTWMRESRKGKAPLLGYMGIMKHSGWEITHIFDCHLSTQRFLPNMGSRMQKNRALGVLRRSLIVGRIKRWNNMVVFFWSRVADKQKNPLNVQAIFQMSPFLAGLFSKMMGWSKCNTGLRIPELVWQRPN